MPSPNRSILDALMEMLSYGKDGKAPMAPAMGREVGTGSTANSMRAAQGAQLQAPPVSQPDQGNMLARQNQAKKNFRLPAEVPPMPNMGSINSPGTDNLSGELMSMLQGQPNMSQAPNMSMPGPDPLSEEQENMLLNSRKQALDTGLPMSFSPPESGQVQSMSEFTAPVDLIEQRMGDMLGRGPAADTNTMYPIAKGDNLTAIGSRAGLTVEQLMQLNPQISNPNSIQAGQQLNLGNAVMGPQRPAFGGKPNLAVQRQGMMGPPHMSDPPMPSASVQAPSTSDPLELLRAKLRGGATQTPMRKPMM
jgi:LysM repeat protein